MEAIHLFGKRGQGERWTTVRVTDARLFRVELDLCGNRVNQACGLLGHNRQGNQFRIRRSTGSRFQGKSRAAGRRLESVQRS